MTAKPIILLDNGGVLNDNRLRGLQRQRLVGEFVSPRLGGEARTWAEANRIHMTTIFEQIIGRNECKRHLTMQASS